jgi:hypothetical protein
MKVIIATYSKRNALILIAVLLSLELLTLAWTLYSPDGHTIAPVPYPLKFALQMEIIVWICGLLIVLFVSAPMWQLIADQRRAIWIRDGKLIHLHKRYQSADRDDIEEVSTGTFGIFNRPAVIVRTRRGRRMEIPAYLLSEPADVIVARLKEELTVAQLL